MGVSVRKCEGSFVQSFELKGLPLSLHNYCYSLDVGGSVEGGRMCEGPFPTLCVQSCELKGLHLSLHNYCYSLDVGGSVGGVWMCEGPFPTLCTIM